VRVGAGAPRGGGGGGAPPEEVGLTCAPPDFVGATICYVI
jgi:hypothetical protein